MNNVILRSSIVVITPLIYIFSIAVLLKGHNEPGGGFIGGLIAAVAWAIYALGTGKNKLFINVNHLIAIGFLLALASAVYATLSGLPFMTGLWGGPAFYIPTIGTVKISTVFFFDTGVYIVVFGAAVRMLRSFME